MNKNEMILLAWYKGSEDSPWVVSLEDNQNLKHNITIGNGGRVAIGPRLTENLEYMNNNIYRYPFTYDMRQTNSKISRLVEVKVMAEKITYIEVSAIFTYELKNSFYQTPFVPMEEDVQLIKDSRYIESAAKENRVISTMSSFGGNTRLKETKNSSTLLTEYAENTNIFWLFMEPKSLKAKSSSQIQGYISAYNWPEGYVIPDFIKEQNMTDAQTTVTIDLLGVRTFSDSGLSKKEQAISYGLYGESVSGPYDTKVFQDVDREARGYLESFISSQKIIAISLQYSKSKNSPVSNNNNLLGVVYGTDFTSFDEVENSIINGNFRAVNLNKSLLKERYSKNTQVKVKNPSAKNLPIVEYVNQTKGKSQMGLNPVPWIDEVGIIEPPEYKDNPIYNDGHVQSVKKEEEIIESIVEQTVKKDKNNDYSRKSHYIEGYTNNDISYVPPKDDRLESGEIYGDIYIPNPEHTAGAIPYDYTHKVRIGDSMFEVPPLSIRSDKEQANESVPTMRSRNAMQKGIGTTRQVLTLELYFHDLDNINGHEYHAFTRKNGEEVYYYMDGLRSLLAQFMRTPFVPIDNDYINNSLGINNVAMRDIQAQTVEGFPEALAVTLVLEEIDLSTYLMGESSLGSIMNYPLFRWYYQQSLHRPSTSFNKNTYLPRISNLDNTFSFKIADEDYLSNRADVIRQFNKMKKPRDFKRDLEKEMAKKAAKNKNDGESAYTTSEKQKDSRSAKSALDSYKKYQKYYNGLPGNLKSNYGPHQLPILTSKGEKNVKNGFIQEIPRKEYEIALGVASAVYGPEFEKGSVISYVERASSGKGRLKERFGASEKESLLVGTYQLPESNVFSKMIRRNKIPGILQLKIIDRENQKMLRDLLKKALKHGLENEDVNFTEKKGGIFAKKLYNDWTFFIPAGTVAGINFLSVIEKLAGESAIEEDEKVDDYTRKYNELANIVNSSEEDIPMHEIIINDLIPLSLNVGISNNLSLVQTQAAESPSLQYLGGQQPEVQLTFSTTDEGAKQIDGLFRKVGSYAKKYRVGMVTNFLEISNSLVNLFGVKSVLPNVFQINTVDGQPNEKIITMVLVGFDKTQRRQEAINQFTGGKTTKDMYDLHMSGFDPQVNALYINEKIKNMELYPDLELPTYSELGSDIKYLKSGVRKFENRRGQIYLDPDFYVSTQTTVRKELSDLLGDKRTGAVHYSDDIGLEADSNPLDNKHLNLSADMTSKINKIDESEEVVDPYLEWRGFDGEGEEENKNSQLKKIEKELSGATSPGTKSTVKYSEIGKPSASTLKKWGVNNKNPNTIDVYNHLRAEVLRLYKNDKTISKKEILNTDWGGTLAGSLKDAVSDMTGIIGGNPTIDNYQDELDEYLGKKEASGKEKINKVEQEIKDLPKQLDTDEIELIKASPTDYFSAAIDSAGTFNPAVPTKQKGKALKNGIHEKIKPEEIKSATIKHALAGNYWELSNLSVSIKDSMKYSARGQSFNIHKMPMMRVFMNMKTIIKVESDWAQFDEEGKPLVNEYSNNKKPFKVGIMGAPLSKSSSKSQTQRLAWDWKYNITFSLEHMKKEYDKALNNHYYEMHLRRLDWAVASHSGMVMPPILNTAAAQHDIPYTPQKLLIAPESIFYFSQFGAIYRRESTALTDENASELFRSPDGISKEAMIEELGISKAEAEEMIEEYEVIESFNTDKYTLEEKMKHMYVSMQEYNHVGRLVRAFPSFTMMLIDEGKWFQNFRTWDNFYGYNSLNSIDVYKSRKIAADTAVISMSNMYGNLTSSETNPGPDLPAFFSTQFFDHYILGKPTEEQIETRAEIYDQMMLQTGARIHLRMGYGSDATALPVMFNGSIAEMTTGEIIEITAQGDAVELQNVISGDPKDDNVGFLNRVQEPRRTIGELMTSKGNWLKDMVNEASGSMFFKDVASGIVHFGSTVDSELGNRSILPGSDREEFGESLQNVYSQNGMQAKSQWRNSSGTEITKVDMVGKHAKSLITSFGSVVLGATPAFDEANIAVSYYGRTVWDVIQTFSLASQDYIATVEPFEYRSTLFFGKPHWMMQYRYDSDFIYDSDRKKVDRILTKSHIRTFMQAHIYSSTHNIISNNVMASEDGIYNNVVVTYDGRQAGPIQADSDIRMDKQRTVNVEANLLAPRLIEYYRAEDQALIYGQSALRDFMKDMYKGQYTVIGDPAVTPYDVVFMNDSVSDIHGLHLVKAVHHSMSPEHGYVTHIEPDAYVYNFDKEMGFIPGGLHSIGKNLNMHVAGKSANKLSAAIVLGPVINKVMGTLASGYSASILSAAKTTVAPGLVTGTNTYALANTLQSAVTVISPGGTNLNMVNAIRKASTAREVAKATQALTNTMSIDLAATGLKSVSAEVAYMTKALDSLTNVSGSLDTIKTTTSLLDTATKAGQVVKGMVTTKTFMMSAALVGIEISTAWIGEMWNRNKQNAEAIKVVPLIHKGHRWTALMNWHKGSVLGDDPSLMDKLMNAEFFDKDLDPEVKKVFGNTLFKILNLF